MVQALALEMLAEVAHLDERIKAYEARIHSLLGGASSPVRRLMQLCGIGEMSASATVAMIGNGRDFRCGRQFAAWLGLVPSQYSSGGKVRLGRITKSGDAYLRGLLVMGARAVLAAAHHKTDRISRWAVELEKRKGYWKAVVAIAAKNARMAWALLSKGEAFRLAT